MSNLVYRVKLDSQSFEKSKAKKKMIAHLDVIKTIVMNVLSE